MPARQTSNNTHHELVHIYKETCLQPLQLHSQTNAIYIRPVYVHVGLNTNQDLVEGVNYNVKGSCPFVCIYMYTNVHVYMYTCIHTCTYSDRKKDKATQHNTRPESTFSQRKSCTQVGFELTPHIFYAECCID